MLTSYLSATLERADLVLRQRDGQERGRIAVEEMDAVEHLALTNAVADPQPPLRWSVMDLDAALERHQWVRVGHWRIDAARRTTTRVSAKISLLER